MSNLSSIIICLLTTIAVSPWQAKAQEVEMPNTIFNSETINGFGQFDIKYSKIKDEPVLILGGQGGVILNRHIMLGISAHSMAYQIKINEPAENQQNYLHLGQSGLLIGYIIAPKKVIHLSVPLVFGAGMATISNKLENEASRSTNYVDLENSLFLFAEPGVQMEINVFKYLKLNLGASYRFNHNLELASDLTSSDLNNWTGNFSVVIGKF